MNIQYAQQSDLLILAQGSDYVGNLALKFVGDAGSWPALQSAKFGMFEYSNCGESIASVYVTDAIDFVATIENEVPTLKFEINRTYTAALSSGTRIYGYEVSGDTVDGAITRICWGHVTVQASIL